MIYTTFSFELLLYYYAIRNFKFLFWSQKGVGIFCFNHVEQTEQVNIPVSKAFNLVRGLYFYGQIIFGFASKLISFFRGISCLLGKYRQL